MREIPASVHSLEGSWVEDDAGGRLINTYYYSVFVSCHDETYPPPPPSASAFSVVMLWGRDVVRSKSI